ncbi:MAG TPA: hypothetical protein VMM79_02085 [Longimicrobiales bacterium]|nr:hypothetical protein [Longimicrobiales bacterium]
MWNTTPRRRLSFITVFAAATALVACGDSTGPDDHEEIPHEVRLTVGSQVITINEDGVVTGGPITIPVGSTNITAVFLDDEGDVIGDLSADEYELQVTSDNAAVASFNRTSAFAGSLVGGMAGQTVLRFSLFHLEEQHEDFGPFPVTVVVS